MDTLPFFINGWDRMFLKNVLMGGMSKNGGGVSLQSLYTPFMLITVL